MSNNELYELLIDEISNMDHKYRAVSVSKIANRLYKLAPVSDKYFLEFIEKLIASKSMSLFSVGTIWFSKRKSVLKLKYFPIIESWLYKYIDSWWACDQFSGRILNAFINEYPLIIEHVKIWIFSDKVYVRRAAPVSLIKLGKGINVTASFNDVIFIVESLRNDDHVHIKKGIGWLLKCSYKTYNQEVVEYLKKNYKMLSRTTFRYALEKMPIEVKKELMSLSI